MKRNRVLAVAAAGFLGAIALSGVARAPTSPHHAAMSGHAASRASRAMLTSVTDTQIINDYAGLCLDAENDSSDNPNHNGDKVQLWTCGGTKNQLWTVNGGGSSWVTITNAYSGKCLDAVASGAGKNGDRVQLWTCTGAANQKWYVYNPGASDPIFNGGALPAALALDAVESGAGKNGDPVQLWQDNNELQQLWVY